MSARCVWRDGPPPSVGWWPASITRSDNELRWWNGLFWSVGVANASTTPSRLAARTAARPSQKNNQVEWTDRPTDWPKESYT